MKLFFNIDNTKLKEASLVWLITDIWTNKSNVDFIALGASLINEYFEKEILIINMWPMSGTHAIENIKKFEKKRQISNYISTVYQKAKLRNYKKI